MRHSIRPSSTETGVLPLFALTLVLALGVVGSSACGGSSSSRSDDGSQIKVITSLPLFADFVHQIGGDRVEVAALLPSGADPHTFEPAPRDVERVSAAQVAFINGLDLEPSAEKMIRANLGGGKPIIALADEARKASVQVIDDNPHLWLDIGAAQDYARIVRDTLEQADPNAASTYDANYERYAGELEKADSYARQKIAAVPQANRKLVTTHDGFPYLARYLGLQIVAFAEEAPGQESSPNDIAQLTNALHDQGAPAVFTEPQIESANKILEQAASDAGVQVCTLYSDSLDDKVRSYVEVMRFDADELARCLGGPAGAT